MHKEFHSLLIEGLIKYEYKDYEEAEIIFDECYKYFNKTEDKEIRRIFLQFYNMYQRIKIEINSIDGGMNPNNNQYWRELTSLKKTALEKKEKGEKRDDDERAVLKLFKYRLDEEEDEKDFFHFGRYKHKGILYIIKTNPNYVLWALIYCKNFAIYRSCFLSFDEEIKSQKGYYLAMEINYMKNILQEEHKEILRQRLLEEERDRDFYRKENSKNHNEDNWWAMTDGQYGSYNSGDHYDYYDQFKEDEPSIDEQIKRYEMRFVFNYDDSGFDTSEFAPAKS